MQTIQINGEARPIATNMRAMRLFKERTGRGMLGFLRELAEAASEAKESEDKDLAAIGFLDSPCELSTLIWAALNGPSGASVPYEDVESMTMADLTPALTAVSEAFAATSMGKGQDENPQTAAQGTTTLTSGSSGASDAAA